MPEMQRDKAIFMTKPELKPCPFCGHGADVYDRDIHNDIAIECSFCNCVLTTFYDKEYAVKIWNTRHQPLEPMYYPSEQMTSINILMKRFTDLASKYGKALQALKEVGENFENIDSDWVERLVKELEKDK